MHFARNIFNKLIFFLLSLFLVVSFQNCTPAKLKSITDSQNFSSSAPPSSSNQNQGCDCGSADANHPCLGNKVIYVAGPSTITFEFQCDGGVCKCGQFANKHDYWVAPLTTNGVVKMTSLLPTTIGTPGNSDYRNGWVVNPDNQNNVGLDGRFYSAGNFQSPQNPSVQNPYIINTSTGVKSIWKADHYPDAEIGSNCMSTAANGDTRLCFLQTALLTVLPDVPLGAGTTVLRPAYFGSTKNLYSIDQLDLSFFPNFEQITRPRGDVVALDWDKALGNLAFPDADWGIDYPATQVHHSKYNWFSSITNGYPAYSPQENKNNALSHLMYAASGSDNSKKELLKIRAIQQGLDVLAILKHGQLGLVNGQMRGGYRPNGGHAVGRYTQALIAAQALAKTDLQWRQLILDLNNSAIGHMAFPETGQFTFNAVTGKYTYGVANVSGGPTYYPNCSSGLTPCQSVNSVMTDPNGNYDDWPEDGNYIDQGAYQAIAWNSTFFAVNMSRAIPALRDLVYIGTKNYVNRMVASGTYTNTSVVTSLKPISYCVGGANAGRACRDSVNDCGSGSTCTNRQTNFERYIWPAVNIWQEHDSCLDAKTCPGMEGL